ncbi:MAG: BatD family protein [Puniceicoccales bacterium]|nr:BatD family protein [Puniceicoccales bacterium]
MKTRFFTVLVTFLQIVALNARGPSFGTNVRGPSISINARFEPTEVSLYNEVRYIVDITNAFPRSFIPPSVPGLRKRSESLYQSSTMVNGVSTQKVTFIFSYVAEQAGVIEMPRYNVEINGEHYPVMPAKVNIVSNPHVVAPRQEQGIALSVLTNVSEAYVGQNVPITIAIQLSEYAQLSGTIKPKSLNDAFLLSSLSKQPRVYPDSAYEIYSWDTFITPLKSGDQQISFEVSCPIQVIRTMGFFSLAEEELISLVSHPVALKVHSLPEAPADFRGGIGQFSLKNLRLSSDRALVDEPITLSIDIIGEGNFSRLQPPEIASDEWWKTFPPKATFVAQDDYDFKGTKTVEYVIVPQKTGEIALPNITLTYFNPQTKRFETSTIDNSKKIVLVSRSTETFANDTDGTEKKSNGKNNFENTDSTLHIFSKDTPHHKTLLPIYFQSWFWILQVCLAIIALLFLIKTWTSPRKEKTPKWNIKKIEKSLVQAANGEDVTQFYKLATQFINQKLATYSISTKQRSEQMRQLQERDIKHLKWLESFLNEMDAIAFGQSQVDKKHIGQQLEKLLMFLKQP